MSRATKRTRRRILDAAYELFWGAAQRVIPKTPPNRHSLTDDYMCAEPAAALVERGH